MFLTSLEANRASHRVCVVNPALIHEAFAPAIFGARNCSLFGPPHGWLVTFVNQCEEDDQPTSQTCRDDRCRRGGDLKGPDILHRLSLSESSCEIRMTANLNKKIRGKAALVTAIEC